MKKKMKVISIAAICTFLLAGCADNEAQVQNGDVTVTPTQTVEDNQETPEENVTEGNEAAENGQIFGIVENVTENEITIGMGQGGMMPENQTGADQPMDGAIPPEQPEGNTEETTPPEQPEGNTDGTMPQNFNQTFRVDSGTSVTTEDGSAGAITDIQIGDFVTIEPDETREVAGNITIVSPEQMQPQGGMMQGGEFAGGQPPELPDGEMPNGGQFGGGQPGGMPGEFGGNNAAQTYTAVAEYTEAAETTGEVYESTGTDENAIRVSGAEVTLNEPEITRNSEDSIGGDTSSFYGVGAAALVIDGTLTIRGGKITTNAAGGAGVFSYGTGVVNISDTIISTMKNTSGGIHVAGGGTLYAANLTVETNGESSAAIRSDRGGGTMVVDGGTYTSNGNGSPAVYCTADITISNAELTATGSEAICIEGLNSLLLNNCVLSGNIPENSQNDCNWNVILYQSMSGDSEIGNSSFSMTDGTLTANHGGMFYTTNTESTFYLSNVDIVYSDSNDFFLKCTGNANQRGWGTTGANGADCTFTADGQDMMGNIIWDSISNLDFFMKNGSTLTGAFVQDEACAGNGGNGYANVFVDATSKWVVTNDSTVTALNCAGTICDVDGNSVSIVGTDGTVYLQGTSSYSITVQTFSDTITQ